MNSKQLAVGGWQLVVLALALAGCDYRKREEVKTERTEKLYQEALVKYKAGDLKGATDGFAEAVKKEPTNASAWFQLAVLWQDAAQDYIGAMAAFRQYEFLAPASDKVPLARERAAKCEPLLARELAGKYGYAKADDLQKELEDTGLALAKAQEELADLNAENDRLAKEVDRLKSARVVRPPVEPAETSPAPVAGRPGADKDEGTGALKAAQALLAEAREEDDTEKLPTVYVVKEGDTLFSIARANYGTETNAETAQCVKRIKEANPRSMTENLRPGIKLHLPPAK